MRIRIKDNENYLSKIRILGKNLNKKDIKFILFQ